MSGCLKWVIIVWTVFVVGAFFMGAANVGDAMNKGQTTENMGGFAIIVSIFFHSAIWAALVIPSYLLMKIFGKKEVVASKLCQHCGKYHNSDGKFCPLCGGAIF